MTSLPIDRVDSYNPIIKAIESHSQCPTCGKKMDMSIFVDLESQCPLQISWMCFPCSHSQSNVAPQDLNMAVPGMTRNEKLESVLCITKSLNDHTGTSEPSSALHELLQIALASRIRISYLDLTSTSIVRGLYFDQDGRPYILIDEALKANSRAHIEVLAEQVGRYFAHKAVSVNQDDAIQEETQALRWALHFLSYISEVYGRAS